MAQFRPMARIISHLGERLISNSKVALLELIKNSYDAKSKFVEIIIDQANRTMTIYDEGHGMNDDTLHNNWLVVGTSNRLDAKDDLNKQDDIPLGEKGLGRFSTMKLGDNLILETTTKDSDFAWRLEIDWTEYGYKSKKFLDEVENSLLKTKKDPDKSSYTRIIISGLKEFTDPSWNDVKIEQFIKETASKYMNPFITLPRTFEIKATVISNGNQRKIRVGEIDKLLFQQAHHEIEGFYTPGKIHLAYVIRRNGEIIDTKIDVINVDGNMSVIDPREEGYVGDFSFHFYIFNRRRLGELKGFESRKLITEILDRYTGGPMIFRDGFRIFPYGEAGDDWLELNKQKFRKGKTSIIGEQTAGFIAINSNKSPYLVDQTNREGLVKNKSYENFKSIIQNIFSTLLEALKRNEPKETSIKITDNAKKSAKEIEKIVNNLYESGSVSLKDAKLIVRNSKKIEKGFDELKNREQALVETAAIGMTSIQIAHEIHNFMHKTTSILNALGNRAPDHLKNDIDLLEINFKSLRTMISQIDEQAVTLRRYKSTVNLVQEIMKIVEIMNNVAQKYETPIKVKLVTEVSTIKVKVNRGLIIQLFDNLILNSLYWIDSLKFSDGTNEGLVEIKIFEDGRVWISDNGPGITKIDADAIFEPFFSRKQEGRGLGLFISREIAAFHDISLELLDYLNQQKRFYCFQIDFSKILEG